MKRAFLCGVLALFLSYPILDAGAQSMSHEEEVVRNGYARLSFLCSLPPLTKAGMAQLGGEQIDPITLEANIARATPSFVLSDFQTGTVASIANETWGTFVTFPLDPPQGEILKGGSMTESYTDNGNQTEWEMTSVQWAPAQEVNPEAKKSVLEKPVSEIIKLGSVQWQSSAAAVTFPVTYTRYAAFTVNATFQGKSSGPYKAIFFFGNDIHGHEYVAENDLVSQIGLESLLNDRVDLSGLLLGKIREAPALVNWIRTNVMSASNCPQSTQALCCSRGRCGISSTEFNRDLAIPLPSPKN